MRTPNKSSGIKGVTFKSSNGGRNKYWLSRIQGRINISRRFPFTDEGKIMASEFYKRKLEENKYEYYKYIKS